MQPHRWQPTRLPRPWDSLGKSTGKEGPIRTDMEKQTGSKLGMECIKAVYCHPASLTYMQSTSFERPGWMKHKLESRLQREISITSVMQMTQPYCRKQGGTKEHLDESERGEWKNWLQFSRSVVSDSATPWTAALQAFLCITNSWSLLILMSIESVMPSNHLIFCCPFSWLQSFPGSGSFPMSQFFTPGSQRIGVSASASVLQWIFRTDFL